MFGVVYLQMKFCLVGPGGTAIPPNGWGAVESIVWDYYENLVRLGHIVVIVNTADRGAIVAECNGCGADVVYIMYDDHIVLVPHLTCKRIYYMSHYAYITHPGFREIGGGHYYNNIFKWVIQYQDRIVLNAISREVLDVYLREGYRGKWNVIGNGAREDLFVYRPTADCLCLDRSIYVGKVEFRKGQYKYQGIVGIDFAGNYHDSPFDQSNRNYLGEWNKATLYDRLTNYGNLVLLSGGEADPLVVKEALIAGLGVVVSECAAANLDRRLPFVTVIPDARLDDIEYVSEAIMANRRVSVGMREQIREYGMRGFSWGSVIDRFLGVVGVGPKRIALVGPGIMPIPPPGWGAVEILIWDYYRELVRLGHTVDIVNPIRGHPMDQSDWRTPYCQDLIRTINAGGYDFVHIHYDCLWHIMPWLVCGSVGITSHYPYIDQLDKHSGDGYSAAFAGICANSRHVVFALSQKDYDVFYARAQVPANVRLALNGANHREIGFVEPEERIHKDRSIYIGKVEERKQQYKYCGIPGIDFYGKCEDAEFRELACYRGEPSREKLMSVLCEYGNLVLLSRGENGTPLVIKEALMAGLPIVTNRHSANDLNGIGLLYVDIIPDDKLDDMEYVEGVISENRKKSVLGKKIRKYAISQFSWEVLIKKYVDIVNTIL
jgi:hypothetical protein